MRTQNRGFTLIELMIVIAIIAILAAIAFGAYQDYVIRAQVSEGLSLSLVGGSKDAITLFYTNNGTFPSTAASIDLPPANQITGTYVSGVDIGVPSPGLVRVSYSSVPPFKANLAINGTVLFLSPVPAGGSMMWTCLNAGNTVAPKYLPPICRQ